MILIDQSIYLSHFPIYLITMNLSMIAEHS